MVAGKKNWVCTDPDCVQFRREAPEHGHNVFELAQVNQYGAGLFSVAHGFVYLDNDLDGHERDLLCELYDWDAEIINSPDFNAILAETVFETSATEYDTSEEYQTFKDAALAVGRLIGVDEAERVLAHRHGCCGAFRLLGEAPLEAGAGDGA